ncbi:hypothetical protein [Amycolatopsis sp. FDAARGOS 1241]|uniref:hypothetical protein n=1 Tax=Amycolatopsis sp. FDAARGOS 1241 TaxID=2778070 RepID=UPI001950F81E|nr:hypothetical protein [Amycolatopsis sp. FDAARGOS 1241]QRP50354.1 hypothetical protein I6J71_23295 [Amycolatopsis sp. FDAARGOS 1241]
MESQFVGELRRGIVAAQDASIAAAEAGQPDEADLHRGRLADLLHLAGEHDVDTAGLVRPDVLAAPADDRAALSE